MPQLSVTVTIKPSEALRLLSEASKLPDTMLALDTAGPCRAVLDLCTAGAETAQRLVLNENGTWYMESIIVIGNLP